VVDVPAHKTAMGDAPVRERHDNRIGATMGATTGATTSTTRATTGVAPTVGDVVGAFKSKSITTVLYTRGVKRSGWPPFVGRLWQRNYYEHIIRDERESERIRTSRIRSNERVWSKPVVSDGQKPIAFPTRRRRFHPR